MDSLFRVISGAELDLALRAGRVPRCASDERSGHIHLNIREDVEAVANAYFSLDERPVALEISRTGIEDHLVFRPPVSGKPWTRVALHQPHILMSSVAAVHHLEVDSSVPSSPFRWAGRVQQFISSALARSGAPGDAR